MTVMDTSIPGTTLDENSISNHYYDFIQNVAPHWFPNEKGHNIIKQTVEKIKQTAKNDDFDCILGLSGGLDSSYMLHSMVKNYGLRPLVFHVDGGWNSEIAVNNINNLIDKLNLDLYTEVINWNEMKDFQLAMFKSGVPHIDIPQDLAFIGVLYKFAKKYKIKYIINGGNISTECVPVPLDILYWGTDMRHIKHILKKYGTIEMKTYPFSSIFYHKIWLRYFKGIKVFKPLNYMPYNKEEIIRYMEDEYKWKPYPQKHFESRFTSFFEGYWLPTRFNFDMRKVQFSSLILTGQMKRDIALDKLKIPSYSDDKAKIDFDFVASKLDISIDELKHYHEMPKHYYWDYKNNNRLLNLGEKVLSSISKGRRGGAF